ncbi:MAG: 2-hydroxyacyl-CoA dehydratase [Candidatus Fermentibacterota bacterium]
MYHGTGPVLAYLCRAFPPAVAAGLGMRPLRPVHRLSGAMARRGEEQVRPDVCPAVKAVLGAALTGEGPVSGVDVWAGLATCDGTRRLFGELEGMTRAPVIPLHLPSTRTPEAAGYYAGEMEAFAGYAVDRDLSEGWDSARAGEYEAAFRGAAGSLRRAALSGRADPVELAGLLMDFSTACPTGGDAELAHRIDRADSREYSPTCRVAVLEVPGAPGDGLIPEALSARGAGMVALGCGALWGIPEGSPPPSPSPGDLAREYFDAVLCARCRPNDTVFEHLERTVDETGVDGLVVTTMRFCDMWFAERLRIRARMPVPVLVLDRDLSPAGRETAANRLDAFLDSLEAAL